LWRNLALAFGALWLITLILLLRQRQTGPKIAVQAAQPDVTEIDLLKTFQRACEQSDAARARQSLGHWLKRFGPAGLRGSLVEFARKCEMPELTARLRGLDAVGFEAGTASNWDGPGTWAAFKSWRQNSQQQKQESPLAVTDLYARS
jgi:hypothetical protein